MPSLAQALPLSLSEISALFLVPPLVAIVLIVHYSRTRTRSYQPKSANPHEGNPQNLPLPPGPKGLPIVGSAWDIPTKGQYLKFDEWGKEFGPIYSYRSFNSTYIILTRAGPAIELLDRRSAIYSDRPPSYVAGGLVSQGHRLLLKHYGEKWRKLRKLLHGGLTAKKAESYQPIQLLEGRKLLVDMINDPGKFRGHIRRYAASTVLTIAYSLRVPSPAHPLVLKIEECTVRLTIALNSSSRLVDDFSWLQKIPSWFPGGGWKRQALEWHEYERELFEQCLFDVKRRMREGVNPNCFSSQLLEQQAELGMSDTELAYASGALYGAGSDTTAAALSVFVLAMAHLSPAHGSVDSIQARAQAEIDRVVGRNRAPTFEDQKDLPYVRALIKEVARWRPVNSGGIAHRLIQDDVYNGYFLPAGSIVIANHWSIHRDPELYPDPDRFDPTRFLKENAHGQLEEVNTEWSKDRGHHQFGFGRRICVGLQVAERSLFINVAGMLWAFNITKALGHDGKDVDVDTFAFTGGISSHPLPFAAHIAPRFPEVPGILKTELSELENAIPPGVVWAS